MTDRQLEQQETVHESLSKESATNLNSEPVYSSQDVQMLIDTLELIAQAGTSRDNGYWFYLTATNALENLNRKESK